MPAPIFDVLAQTEVAPTGNAQTIYTPPTERAAVIAGVRVVSKWPTAERAGAYPSSQYNGSIYFYKQDPYDSFDITGDGSNDIQNSGGQWKQFFLRKNETIQQKIPQYIEESSYQKNGSQTIFTVMVGNSPVTGHLITPDPMEHLDIKVPVITNQKPLKITNGIVFKYRDRNDRTTLQQMLSNHRKRCPHLAVTVFGQLVDNT